LIQRLRYPAQSKGCLSPQVSPCRKSTVRLARNESSYLRRRRNPARPSSEVPSNASVPGSGAGVTGVPQTARSFQPSAHINWRSAVLTDANSPWLMKALKESFAALIQSPLSDVFDHALEGWSRRH